ncbi:MAG TPA: ABC transporter permease [Acidimicrobiia bacterium]|nr:ABC transporter permease [Acidimicrobiia bacterium]
MTAVIRTARNAALVGFEETRAAYSWRTWLFGWMVRVAAQILFFSAIGLLVESDDLIGYAFVGNVVAMTALSALAAGPDTAWERGLGTLPLLVAAPGSLLPVFAGRSAFHMVQGAAEGTFVFAVLAPIVALPPHWWWMPLCLAVVAVGTYGLGVAMAAFAIRRPRFGNLVFNFVFFSVVAISGVNVPTAEFPGGVQAIARLLPMHHGLLGARSLLESGWSAEVLTRFALEVAVGAGWLTLGMLGFKVFVERSRRDGTIDLEE